MDADEQEKSVLVSTPDAVALVLTVVLVIVFYGCWQVQSVWLKHRTSIVIHLNWSVTVLIIFPMYELTFEAL